MTIRAKFLLTCVAGALVIGAGPMISTSHAADAAMPTKAKPAAEPVPFWWFSGYLEVGGRFFLNNPQKDGISSQGGKSLGKYYEYRDLRPGPFGNAHLATGTSNGLYQVDVWAKNIGYDDQRFDLNASKAGEHYFNFQWDETPHNYGTGNTLFNGVGSNALTLPSGLGTQIFNAAGGTGAVAPLTGANLSNVRSIINNNLQKTDIGIRRDTASAEYRWTPTDAWDVKADYSHLHRTGTQVEGVVMDAQTSAIRVDAPRPVDDTTQNFGLNGEYVGTSPWGKRFNIKLGYQGSVYQDASDSYTVQNPFCEDTGALRCPFTFPAASNTANNIRNNGTYNFALMSLPPDNQANAFNATLGADLPAKSRYMGTVSYNMMRQNENFLPFSINPTPIIAAVNNGAVTYGAFGAPVPGSLNGAINTLLVNNVLTTQITPELKSKLSYRYYDFDNSTPELLFNNWVLTDSVLAGVRSGGYAPVSSISISYTKQNAGAELNWRPIHQLNLGAAYGYERYDWTRADVDTTNENSGKVFADWKPFSWVTARASWLYAQRRYDTYNYLGFVGTNQWPNAGGNYSTAYRQFYLDNRDRNKARFSVSVDVLRNLTVTPTFGLQNDDFKLDQSTEVGLLRDHAWNAGVDVTYVMSPDTKFLFSYMYEHRSQVVSSSGQNTPPFPVANYYTADVENKVNTFIVAVDHALIPNKLDLRLGYTTSLATVSQPLYFANGTVPSSSTGGQYPDIKTTFQRLEAVAKYTFDDDLVRRLGWKGKVTAKLGYAYERNAVDNWQLDILAPYTGGAPYCPTTFSCGYMLWLANDNPNYNVHRIMASLGYKW
jgi:MtrB/PioB family decaheme-associated outer membrane protein